MKFDFSCECGKGIRILRGDLAEITCGSCGKAVPVPAAVRSALPSEFRSFAVEAAPVAPPRESKADKVFFGICWAVGIGLFAVPFFVKSQTTELYRKAMADPTPQNIRDFCELESNGSRRDEVVKAGFEKALASGDVERLKTFLGNWGSEYVLGDIEQRVWEFASRVRSEAAYQLYLDRASYSSEHYQDATTALEESRGAALRNQEQEDLRGMSSDPSKEELLAFLDRYPESAFRGAIAARLLEKLEADWQEVEGTPSPSLLRGIVEAKGSNELTVSISGFESDDAKQQVLGLLQERLRAIGLRVTETASDGDIRVTGSERTDSTRTFNKWGLPDSGPFAEAMDVTIDVYVPGGYESSFSTSSYASTPASVEYYTIGDMDVGPSQGDVHRATLTELSSSMESVFRYR